MSPTPADDSFDSSRYQRPNQEWVCGHLAEGAPCPIGPDGGGTCRGHQICLPYRKGDRWECTRPKAWGGKCKEGPQPDPQAPEERAICSHAPIPCRPERSLRGKRRQLGFLTMALTLGCCLLLLGEKSKSAISPGPLTDHHGVIEQGCSACHATADKGPGELLSQAIAGIDGVEDNHRCLECHHLGNDAFHPHSTDPRKLAETTKRLAQTDSSQTLLQKLARVDSSLMMHDNGELSCAACHHEHRGRDFDLAHMTNQQCQVCHVGSFHSFEDGHPPLDNYAYDHRTKLHFDHRTHYGKHFADFKRLMPNGIAPRSCLDCHELSETGEAILVRGFEQSCASCHNDQIRDDGITGMEFFTFRLPSSVSRHVDSLSSDLYEIGKWPAKQRTHRLPPFMELFLSSDQQFVDASRLLQQKESDPENVSKALGHYFWSIKKLLSELVRSREKAVADRLKQIPGLKSVERTRMQHVLSDARFFEAITKMQQRWFPDLAEELKQHASGDKLATQFAESTDDEVQAVKSETWSISDHDLSLRFHARGHADSLLTTWFEISAERGPSDHTSHEDEAQLFSRFLEDGIKPEATGGCFKCHTLDREASDRIQINWTARDPISLSRGFTEFSHRPHLMVTSAQCESCHRLQEGLSFIQPDFVTSSGLPNNNPQSVLTSGFKPMSKTDCASCHTKKAAGDSCVQCHNYHVGHRFTQTAERIKSDKHDK